MEMQTYIADIELERERGQKGTVKSTVWWKMESGRHEISKIVLVLRMESFRPVHSVPLSPSDSLWPHPNHCLIIQTEQLLSRLLCFRFHCNPIAYVYSLLLSGVRNKQRLFFLFKLHGLPRAIRALRSPHSQQFERARVLIWPTFL